jgi:hypothetical protein
LIQQRVQALPGGARDLLDTIAIAGEPLPLHVAPRAVQLDDAAAPAQLLAEHLTRACRAGAARAVDTYHDRVREAILALMSPERQRDCHARLASSLELDIGDAPERLVHHLVHAGIYETAYRRALQAAERVREQLAFDRVARFLRVAIDLGSKLHGSAAEVAVRDEPVLRERLAESLAHAGRANESAHEYLEAAARATPEQARDLRRLASGQLMRGGSINEGLALLTDTLRDQRMGIPRSRTALIARLVVARARIRLGLAVPGPRPAVASRSELAQIDHLWTAGATLMLVDPLLSLYLRSHHLLASLAAGAPRQLAVGLAFEAMYRAMRFR